MARTHIPRVDPVSLDRQGNPVAPSAQYLARATSLSGNVTLKGPGAEPLPAPLPIGKYRCDRTTVSKSIEGYDLFLLTDLALKYCGKLLIDGFIVELTPDQYAAVPGDAKRHFRPVYEQPTVATD